MAIKGTKTQFKCNECNEVFSKAAVLKKHRHRSHLHQITISINGVDTVIMRNDMGFFVCPFCPTCQCELPDSLRRHVGMKHDGQEERDDTNKEDRDDDKQDEDEQSESEETVQVTINPSITMPKTITPLKDEKYPKLRDYDSAVLSAFDALNLPKGEQQKKLMITSLGDLQPIAHVDDKGCEFNLLAAPSVVNRLVFNQQHRKPSFFSVTPMKRKHSDEHLSTAQPASFFHTISNSPWKNALSNEPYVELDCNLSACLNGDWTQTPSLRYLCAKIFEGMVFIEKNKALLVNCAEVYGRLPSTDVHYERTALKRNEAPLTSLPGINTRYEYVELVILKNSDNSNKLVLGTKTMNVLITSSIRIDVDKMPTIGSSSSNGFKPTKGTQIFVQQSNLEHFNSDFSQRLLYPFDQYAQLRQLRSKFHQLSTYLCCRSSSKFTNELRARPLTIWTLADHDHHGSGDSDGRLASRLFRSIASSVWEKGDQAAIDLRLVQELKVKCTPNGKIRCIMGEIEQLFSNELPTIPVIGNNDLNQQLQKLAPLLSPEIVKGNNSISRVIHDIFTESSN
ncbi:hypothetical protein RMATCC62417_18311 [Rhizopus microsporus]|nr:hypothetical protein RMATCC62417_18311 [Rhizopus microsporus]